MCLRSIVHFPCRRSARVPHAGRNGRLVLRRFRGSHRSRTRGLVRCVSLLPPSRELVLNERYYQIECRVRGRRAHLQEGSGGFGQFGSIFPLFVATFMFIFWSDPNTAYPLFRKLFDLQGKGRRVAGRAAAGIVRPVSILLPSIPFSRTSIS